MALIAATHAAVGANTITQEAFAHCDSAVDGFTTASFCQIAAEEFALDADDATGTLHDYDILEEGYCLVQSASGYREIGESGKAEGNDAIARHLFHSLIDSGSVFAPKARTFLRIMDDTK